MSEKETVQVFQPHIGWLKFEEGDEVSQSLYKGYFEAKEQVFYRRYLRKGDGFLDAGAHVGLFSVLAGKLVGDSGRVLSFEPDSSSRCLLEENLRMNEINHAEVFPFGLWREEATLLIQREGVGRSSHNFVAEANSDKDGEKVSVYPISEVDAFRSRDDWALLKIDCEGAEPKILEDALSLITKGRIKVALVEFNEHNLRREGASTARLLGQIKEAGVEAYRLSRDGSEIHPVVGEEPIWYENLVLTACPEFVKKRLSEKTVGMDPVIEDILNRAEACDLFKDLQDLETYRKRSEAKEEEVERIRFKLAGVQKELRTIPPIFRRIFRKLRRS